MLTNLLKLKYLKDMKNLKNSLRYSLYLVLVICSFSGISAQDTTYVNYDWGIYGKIEITDSSLLELAVETTDYSNPDTAYYTNMNIPKAALLLLLTEFSSYEEHCYNDSALTEVPYSCGVVGCLVNHYPIKMYIHKQPTFVDFIAWVRKKYSY